MSETESVTPLPVIGPPLTKFISGQVQAYANHGRWIADCCREFCNNAWGLASNQVSFLCDPNQEGCGMEALVVWPPNVAEITEVLRRRPVKATRNWFPLNHELALRAGCPHGQTVQQLKDEQMEMESK